MVARKAIQAIGRIALRLSTRANTCVDKLLALLIMEIDYITAETLVAMTSEYPPRDIRRLILYRCTFHSGVIYSTVVVSPDASGILCSYRYSA